jgi:hypothetical protein
MSGRPLAATVPCAPWARESDAVGNRRSSPATAILTAPAAPVALRRGGAVAVPAVDAARFVGVHPTAGSG